MAVGVVALAVACGRGGAGGSQEAARTARYRDAAVALCEAARQAGPDVNRARTTFYDRSHDALHAIARDLEGLDRPLTGRLLEAKQAVEAGFDAEPPPPDLPDRLSRLASATRAALQPLGLEVPPC
jgi:hypothetical protein